MGFEKQNLSMTNINEYMDDWKNKSCQPNNWINVHPDPSKNCGPYTKNENIADNEVKVNLIDEKNHDTIGIIAIDEDENIAVGTSTNGMTYKIPGRVGDSPIPGSGGYADNKVGGAAATGDGDVMMRFSASFLAVELMRNGKTPQEAAELVIARIGEFYPESSAAIVVLDKDGNYGFACQIFSYFSISIYHPELDKVKIEETKCRQIGDPITTTTSAAFRIHFNSIILFFITFLLGMI
ncbi:hypothetical protein PVAND_017475 [Polypedilum vanderplanki]|uniref:N(4)-(beta-N-acetylglucosaminyl)-L-asparaginase n=1 Tax=Polypedilum vanderplanki TaxID=319348 RepID=A0A9J6BIE5_POLVA|nr:hypothetical protein PVAND_017475 [Polypedilum vanderplanki]